MNSYLCWRNDTIWWVTMTGMALKYWNRFPRTIRLQEIPFNIETFWDSLQFIWGTDRELERMPAYNWLETLRTIFPANYRQGQVVLGPRGHKDQVSKAGVQVITRCQVSLGLTTLYKDNSLNSDGWQQKSFESFQINIIRSLMMMVGLERL